MRLLTLICATSVLLLADTRPMRMYSDVPAIRSGQKLLWRNPGRVERLDLRYGIGGRTLAPRPPFRLLQQDTSGTTPKVLVRDAAGRQWSVKFGREVSADVFGSRMAWAAGYYAEPTYYVARGVLRGTTGGKRLSEYIDAAGRFQHARFQLRSKSPEYLSDVGWSWNENPFAGSRQLNGLKVLMMLLSNWDDKDIRDAARRGSNTAIYREGARYLFFVNDWGAAMGNWGHGPTRLVRYITRAKWNCEDFSRQTENFVKVREGELDWRFQATHTKSMTEGVSQEDVRWIMRYLGRLTARQIHAALVSSGAGPADAACYTDALLARLRELSAVSRIPLTYASR